MEGKEIIWRKVALLQLEQIYDYILEEASESAALKLIDSIEKCIKIIALHPTAGMPSTKKKGVRSYRLLGNRRLYYLEKDDKIFILFIFDLHQDPAKNKY